MISSFDVKITGFTPCESSILILSNFYSNKSFRFSRSSISNARRNADLDFH